MKRAVSLIAGIVLASMSPAVAGKPRTIHYQAEHKDTSGNLVHGESVVLFTIYDAASGGNVLWQERHGESGGPALIVEHGLVDVMLGSLNPIPDSVINRPNRWLGIQVGADPEIAIRILMTPGTQAFRMPNYGRPPRGAEASRRRCSWSTRGQPGSGKFSITEFGLKYIAGGSERTRQSPSATMEFGVVQNLTTNSGLGGTIYLATGDDWRIGPKIRFRRWLNDYLAVDVASGVTWNMDNNDKHKLGYASYVGVNLLDKVILNVEYDVFPGYHGELERITYFGISAGSKTGLYMTGISAALVVLYIISLAG
ncbi:MAG: hypothetical protein JSV52_10950 [Candidatus Zixiibacteriota bacterium]|nr:MAG: hypothetical protein JSV52_10950 [candidate division Zixibacteria bacterium]